MPPRSLRKREGEGADEGERFEDTKVAVEKEELRDDGDVLAGVVGDGEGVEGPRKEAKRLIILCFELTRMNINEWSLVVIYYDWWVLEYYSTYHRLSPYKHSSKHLRKAIGDLGHEIPPVKLDGNISGSLIVVCVPPRYCAYLSTDLGLWNFLLVPTPGGG